MYEYLKFPEYDTNSKVEDVMKNVNPLKSYLKSSSHEQIINKNGHFELEALEIFKQLGLYSNSLPYEFNGKDLDATGIARVYEETGRFPSLGMGLIYNNEIAAKSILLYATTEQKDKYLKGISSGNINAGFCYSEIENGVDEVNFKTVARFNAQEVNYGF